MAGSGAVLEPPALVAGLDDIAVMGQAVEQGRCHLGVAEYTGPFAKGQVRGHDHRGLLVEAADQVEQQLAARLRERQVGPNEQHGLWHRRTCATFTITVVPLIRTMSWLQSNW